MKRAWVAAALGLALQGSMVTNAVADEQSMAPVYLHLLRDIVNVNTETRNTAGLAKVRDMLIPHFERLGMVVTRHKLADAREVLSIQRPDAQPRVLLVGHIDTVFSEQGAFQHFQQEGDRLHGPGVIDMKGGLVLMINVLAQLKDSGQLDQVRVVLNDDEEIGSPHSKQTLRALAKDIPYGLVFEPGLEDGAVVSNQSGVRWIKLTSVGKAAHAGLEPENGINACLDLALKVKKLADLAEPEKGLTINPGVIEGGTKPNVVCARASVTLDVRFRSLGDWQRVSAAIERIRMHSDVLNAQLGRGTDTEVVQIADMPPLPETSTHALVHVLAEVTKQLDQPFKVRGVGYGSDGNHLAEGGMQLLVGVGPYGGGMHSEKEFLLLRSYRDRLKLNTTLIRNVLLSGAKAP